MTKRLLVVSPHADDAELGCGGYIARTIAEGGEVYVVVMTISSVEFMHSGLVSVMTREKEFRESAKTLGVQLVDVLSYDLDGKLYTYPQSAFVTRLDAIQERFKPTEVLVPLPSAHQDHRYAYEVCIAATRPSASKWRPNLIAAYEYPASGWGDGSGVDAGHGGIYVDVSRHWHKKMAALDCYQSQMRGPQHLFSLEGAEALAIMRGLECGFKKAELFHALRILI